MKYREKLEIEAGGFGLLPKQDDFCGLESKVFFSLIYFIMSSKENNTFKSPQRIRPTLVE